MFNSFSPQISFVCELYFGQWFLSASIANFFTNGFLLYVFQNICGLLLVNTGKATLWYPYPMLSLFIRQHVLYAIYLKNTRIFCIFFQLQSLWLLIKEAFDMMASLGKWLSKRDQYMYKLRLLFQASQPHNQWESPVLLMAMIYIYPVINTGSSTVWWSYIPSFVLCFWC